MPKMPNRPPRITFQIFWPGTSTMATQRMPSPASKTLRTRLGFSARRWARREAAFLPRDEDERVPVLRLRDELLRPEEDLRLLLFLLERDCAMLNNTPLLHCI